MEDTGGGLEGGGGQPDGSGGGGLLRQLRPIPGVLEFEESRLDEAVGSIRYEAMLDRGEYVRLVQVYLNACKHF